jgi:hypothetical protein
VKPARREKAILLGCANGMLPDLEPVGYRLSAQGIYDAVYMRCVHASDCGEK